MAGTILPIVYGERQAGKKSMALWVYTAGSVAGAAALGGLLGFVGSALPQEVSGYRMGTVALVVTGLLSLIYGAHELELLRAFAPQCRWQVPQQWSTSLPKNLCSLLYGAGLGVGVATRIQVGTFYPVLFWALLVGNPILSSLCMAVYGLGRAVPLLLMAWALTDHEENFRFSLVLHRYKPIIHFVNGLALGSVGSCLLVAGLIHG